MENPRIGVYVCWCGTNIAKMVDVEAVAEEMGKLHNVVISRNYKYMCSDPGQELIIKDIKELKLNRVVVAACSPRIHELTFRKALANAGLNPYLFEMANVREHDSWVHSDRAEATEKAKDLVIGAIERVMYHEPLEKKFVDINPDTLVLGGGISGITAALEIANAGKKVYLIERTSQLGGQLLNVDLTYPNMSSPMQFLIPKIRMANNHPNIDVFLNSEVTKVSGYVGNFEAIVQNNGSEQKLKFGNIITATGLKPFDPSVIKEYGYGKLPDVITSYDFEKLLKSGKVLTKEGKEPKHIAIIHCVGSRNEKYHEYCARVCCMTALKYANQLRSALPESNIYELYADMRAYGKCCEELYSLTSRKNVMFLMFDQDRAMPLIRKAESKDKCNMLIEMHEELSGKKIEVPADMVILMVNMEAQADAKEVTRLVGISLCGNQFFIEKHPKLDPVATTTNGVYIIGTCNGPKDIPDSIAQAKAATARILGNIAQGTVEIEVTTAVVNEDICCGCQTCVKVCPYSAVSYIEEKKVSNVNEILCKGCGTCGSACPTGAIKSRHFTDKQIISQIEGLMHHEHVPVPQNN
jgi:heterodisulfide reductase subunit A